MTGECPTLSPEEITEIERHKYFLSEKAGYDVGWEAAEKDWRARFANAVEDESDASIRSISAGPLGKFLKRLLSKAALL